MSKRTAPVASVQWDKSGWRKTCTSSGVWGEGEEFEEDGLRRDGFCEDGVGPLCAHKVLEFLCPSLVSQGLPAVFALQATVRCTEQYPFRNFFFFKKIKKNFKIKFNNSC